MLKRICCAMTLALITTVCSISVFAAPPDSDIYENDIKSKVQLVDITKPEGKGVETTYNKSFSICGVTKNENIRVHLQRYNEEKGRYEDIAIGKNGKVHYYDIGESGFFSKEIELKELKELKDEKNEKNEKNKINKIRFIAYKISQPSNYQVNYFEIKLEKSTVLDDIKDNIFAPLKSIFTKKD